MDRKKQAEIFAEAFATDFLEDFTGHDIFIGSHIERILADRAVVIYHYAEDQSYFGAAITHQSGEHFIALNTFHSLRTRYFTAAHEIWHLLEASELQDEYFDHERAADRFAAAIMLPRARTKDLWLKLKKSYEPEEAIIHLADLAAVPYETIVRRLKELGETVSGSRISEEEWIKKRSKFNLPNNPLDTSQHFKQFSNYENVIEHALEQQRLDPLTAANKIVKFNPIFAKNLQEQEMERLKEAQDNET